MDPREPMTPRRFALLGALLVLLATGALLPMAGIGFFGDDGIYQLVLTGEVKVPTMRPPWQLFDFGRAADWGTGSELWNSHWWASTDWKIRFFRPLASFSMWLDHVLWDDRAVPRHLTSLLWYALLLILTLALFRALGLSRRTALLALLLFATTNGALVPVGWIANRNSVMALVFTTAALLAAMRLRPGWRLPAALGLAALACASKESGVVAFGLVGAFMTLEARRAEGRRARRRALAGAAAALGLGAGYLLAYAAAGYGTSSLFYATPWREPLRFLARIGVLLTAGSLRLLVPVPLDLVRPASPAKPILIAAGTLVTIPLAVTMGRRLWRHRAAPLLVTWLALALLVEGGAPPSDRLLLAAAVGSAGLLALFVTSTLRPASSERASTRIQRVVAVGVLATAGVLSGVLVPLQAAAFAGALGDLGARIRGSDLPAPAAGRTEAVILQAGGETEAFVFAAQWLWESRRRDVRFSAVQLGRRGLEWTRVDEHTCTLRSLDRPFLVGELEGVYRSRDDPLVRDARRSNGLFAVEPIEVDASGLRSIRLRFEPSLDDPALRFLISSSKGLAPVAPPDIGESLVIPTARQAIPLLP